MRALGYNIRAYSLLEIRTQNLLGAVWFRSRDLPVKRHSKDIQRSFEITCRCGKQECFRQSHALILDFKEVDLTFVRREYNQLADALVKLAFASKVPVQLNLSPTGLEYLDALADWL